MSEEIVYMILGAVLVQFGILVGRYIERNK